MRYIRTPVRSSNQRRGSVTVLVALCMIAIIGIVAIALDGSMLMGENRRGQAIADAAALSAAADLYLGKSNAMALNSALATASANGYTNDSVNSVVTVNMPPTSGDHVGAAGYVEVIVQHNHPRAFSGIFGSGSIPVKARAVARGTGSAGGGAGLLVLNKNASGALTVSGSGSRSVNSGPVIVNSTSSTAMTTGGSSSITSSEFSITGNYSSGGQSQILTNPTSNNIKTGQTATTDPLASLAVPDKTSLTTQSTSQKKVTGSTTVTLQPGVYNGGISIGGGTVTLAPGIYYMAGGGFSITGGNVTGNGVMIYNAPSSNSDTISLGGNGTLNLTPPTSGTYTGITIFQDRTSTTPVSLSGGAGSTIIGSVYAAAAAVSVTGNGASTLGSQYISDTLKLAGTSSFNVDWNGYTPPITKDIRRVE